MDVRFFAGAAEAAGASVICVDADGLTGQDLVELLGQGNDRLSRVLQVSTLLADGVRVADLDLALRGVASVDVLPPFAGG